MYLLPSPVALTLASFTDTLVAAKMWLTPAVFCYGPCHMSIKEVPRVFPNSQKARVCAVMPMWLVHIQEHVWTIGTCPTTILLSAMSDHVNECCIERLNEKEVLPHMRWQVCMLPRELIWEGVAPPQEKLNDIVWKSGLSRKWKIVKQHLKI